MQVRPNTLEHKGTKSLEPSRKMLSAVVQGLRVLHYPQDIDDVMEEYESIFQSFLAFHKIPIIDVIELFLKQDEYAERAFPVRLRAFDRNI